VTLQTSGPRLELELATYEQHRAALLASARGKFALIHQDQLAGVFDTQMAAIQAGYERFGHVPLLVKQVVPVDTPLPFATPLVSI
jgi:hypothetical protein